MSPNFSDDDVETGVVLFGSRTVKNRLFVRNRGDTSEPQRESAVEFVASVVCVLTCVWRWYGTRKSSKSVTSGSRPALHSQQAKDGWRDAG